MEVDETRKTSPPPSHDGGQEIHGVEIAVVPEQSRASPSRGTKLANSSTIRIQKMTMIWQKKLKIMLQKILLCAVL
jgi:hypothetical protein